MEPGAALLCAASLRTFCISPPLLQPKHDKPFHTLQVGHEALDALTQTVADLQLALAEQTTALAGLQGQQANQAALEALSRKLQELRGSAANRAELEACRTVADGAAGRVEGLERLVDGCRGGLEGVAAQAEGLEGSVAELRSELRGLRDRLEAR